MIFVDPSIDVGFQYVYSDEVKDRMTLWDRAGMKRETGIARGCHAFKW